MLQLKQNFKLTRGKHFLGVYLVVGLFLSPPLYWLCLSVYPLLHTYSSCNSFIEHLLTSETRCQARVFSPKHGGPWKEQMSRPSSRPSPRQLWDLRGLLPLSSVPALQAE